MFRSFASLLLVVAGWSGLNAQQPDQDADVAIAATIERTSPLQAELVITAKIADGLHIYAQSQPKPFLATKISTAESSVGIRAVGEFKADRPPARIHHPQLKIELHEFEDSVQWRSLSLIHI